MNVETFFKAEKIRSATALAKARRAVYVRSQGLCEARCCDGCTGQYEQAHHRRRRSQGGNDTPANLVAICGPCHDYIHRHPAEAEELGLLKRSSFDPAPGLVRVEKVKRT